MMKNKRIYNIVIVLIMLVTGRLFCATGDIILKLETEDGSSALHIEDSSGVKVSSITSDGDAYYANNVEIDGTLDVDGSITLNNDVTSTGDLTVSTITSTGDTYLLKDTYFEGDVIVSTINSSGNTYLLKDVDVSGDLSVSTITSTGNLDITGRILPNSTAGSVGDVLTTYTSSMTWTTIPSGKWEGSPNIYYTTGNVGIGTNDPTSKLDVIVPNSGFVNIETTGAPVTESSYLKFQGSRATIGFSSSGFSGASELAIRTADKHIFINTNDTALDNYIFINGTSSDYIEFGTLGEDRMLISSDGNVGIGTANPISKLHVPGAIRSDHSFIVGDGSGKTRILSQSGISYIQSGLTEVSGSSATIRFTGMYGSPVHMVIKEDGNLGIGTTNPLALLHVDNSGILEADKQPYINVDNWADMSANAYMGSAMFANNAYTYGWSGSGQKYYYSTTHAGIGASGIVMGGRDTMFHGENGISMFIETTAGTANAEFTPEYVTTWRESGNVGIGTTDPAAKLDISHTGESIRLSGGADQTYMTFFNGATRQGYIGTTAGGDDIVLNSDFDLYLQPGGSSSYATIIKSNGNVGIGTTNASKKLEINGDVTFTGTEGSIFKLDELGGASDLRLSSSGKENAFYIATNGNVGISTNTPVRKLHVNGSVQLDGTQLIAPNLTGGDGSPVVYNGGAGGFIMPYSSSRRYKENIELFEDDFYKILKLEPKIYNRKNNPPEQKEIGYIAEEVDEAGLKYLVFYDEQGRPDSINCKKIGMYTMEIVRDNLKKIEEQGVEIELLKEQNNELLQRIEKLE